MGRIARTTQVGQQAKFAHILGIMLSERMIFWPNPDKLMSRYVPSQSRDHRLSSYPYPIDLHVPPACQAFAS